MKKRPITFVINSLTSGGAERVIVDLLRLLEGRLRSVPTHLVLLDVEEGRHTPPPWVDTRCLDARFSVFRSVTALARYVRRERPLVCVSFLTRANVATIVACRMAGVPCLVSERVHTTGHLGGGAGAAVQRALVRATYRFADSVVAVSEAIRADLADCYGVPAGRISVIHNPMDVARMRSASLAPAAIPVGRDDVLAIGRLTPNKGFATLIEAFARSGLPGRLVIVGEGPDRDDLAACADRHGVGGRVVLPGYVANPFPLLRAAGLFVSSSLAEGFPNVVVEALAIGCPVVAADCPSGPREILEAGPVGDGLAGAGVTVGSCGIVVPHGSAAFLAEGLRLGADPAVTRPLVERGLRRAEAFGVDVAAERYWSVIAAAMERRSGREPAAADSLTSVR